MTNPCKHYCQVCKEDTVHVDMDCYPCKQREIDSIITMHNRPEPYDASSPVASLDGASEHYSKLYAGGDYRPSGVSKRIHLWLNQIYDTTSDDVVDVGCGLSWLSRSLKYKTYTGLDTQTASFPDEGTWGTDRSYRQARMPNLDGDYDLAICTEVLEHVPPGILDDCIKSLVSVARNQCISVPFRQHTVDGVNLHLTVEDEEWWKATLENMLGQIKAYVIVNQGLWAAFGPGPWKEFKYPIVPDQLYGQRIRQLTHDTISLVRCNAKAEAELDRDFVRIGPLTWQLWAK